MSIFEHLQTHPPRSGPEWGSGGIFGLKYYRGILYYTLAFEAQAYFIDRNGVKLIYEFEKVGHKPVSGGDTYNAVEVVDDKIYFGGWVHAPAYYRGRSGVGATIDFTNKYSHVHYYDINENTVELVWKESMHNQEKWVGEISEIIYNPYKDELLLARADGYANLGVYSLDPRSGKSVKVLDEPALKGTHHLDYACFAIHQYPHGFMGIECIDLIEEEKIIERPSTLAVDGDTIVNPQVGPVVSSYGWLFTFVKGGVIVSDIIDKQHYMVRLLDIPYSQLSPLRTKAVNLGGGILVPYNMYTHALIKPFSDKDREVKRYLNTIVSPSILLYVTPPTVKIVGVFGARVTGVELVGDKIVLATNTMANTGRYDASPFDQGIRGFIVLNQDIITGNSAPLTITIPGWMIRDKTFGGIPLTGYNMPRLIIHSSNENKLLIKEYHLTLPPITTESEEISIHRGKNVIELNRYTGIVSFKFEKPLSDNDVIVIDLK